MTDEVQQVAAPETAAPETPRPTPAWDPEIESIARDWGWKSPEEWKGEPTPGYIDNPERYVEKYERLPVVQRLKKEIQETRRLSEKTQEALSRSFERELQSRMAELQAQKVQAVEVGDVDKFKAIERQQAELSKQATKQEADVTPDHRVAIEQWSVGKDWFRNDPVKTQAAVVLYGQAQQQGYSDPKAILAFVDQEMSKRFADMAPKQAVTPVEAGLTFGGGSQATSFDKLPKDAKDAFQRFVKQGLFKDTKEGRAAYAEDYNAA